MAQSHALAKNTTPYGVAEHWVILLPPPTFGECAIAVVCLNCRDFETWPCSLTGAPPKALSVSQSRSLRDRDSGAFEKFVGRKKDQLALQRSISAFGTSEG
jgi:hypothetical protein